MNKIVKKTAPKLLLWVVLSLLIVLVSGIVTLLSGSGISGHVSNGSYQTLTVSITMGSEQYKAKRADIEAVCEDVIGELDYEYTYGAEISKQQHELVFVFKTTEKLAEVSQNLQNAFDEKTEYQMNFIKVETHQEVVLETLPDGYILRGVIAGVVMAVLAFAYVAIVHKLWNAIVAFVSMGLAAALTCAVVLLTRIPVTATVFYAVEFSLLLTAVLVLFIVSKLRKEEKENNEKAVQDVDALAETVDFRAGITLCAALLVAMAVLAIVGAFCATNFVAFAAIAAIAILMSAFSAFVFAPALYLPLRAVFAQSAAERARYDYKKGAKKEKKAKAAKKTQAPVAETAEAPVEETPVEETEEVSAEEEVPVEEEAPVEEVAEEENKEE